MTSFSEYKYYSPFWDTAEKLRITQKMLTGFREIASIEGFPNLKALSGHMNAPLAKLPKLRQSKNAVKFRAWLETTAEHSVGSEMTKLYIDSISGRKGLFDSTPAKFTKAIVMTAIGTAVGATLAGAEGAKLGASLGGVSAGAIEIASQLGLDLIDSFAVEAVSRGWAPRMFFNDLDRLEREQNKIHGDG